MADLIDPQQTPVAPVPTVQPTPVKPPKAPAPNPDVEGVRQFLNSVGKAGDAYAHSYYQAIQSGGDNATRAQATLPDFINKAWNHKNSTGQGNVLGLPTPGRTRATPTPVGAVHSAPDGAPIVSTASPASQQLNPFQKPQVAPSGPEEGGFSAFFDGLAKNTAPKLIMSAGKLAGAVVDSLISPLAFGLSHVPGAEGLGKKLTQIGDQARAGNDDWLAGRQQTVVTHPGQTNAPVRKDKDGNWTFGLDGTADFWSNVAIDAAPTVATALLTRGASLVPRLAATWAAGTVQAAPGMYAEARQAGIDPKAANLLAYVGAGVSSGLDVVTGGEAKLLGVPQNALAKVAAKVFGKTASTTAEVVQQAEASAFRTAMNGLASKLGKPASEIALDHLDEVTMHEFQSAVRDTKRNLLTKFVANLPANLQDVVNTGVNGGLGEGASALSEKAVAYAYDKFFAGENTKAGAGQYGVDFSTAATWADVANEAIAGVFSESAMDGGQLFRQANVQSAYGAMEAAVRRTGDASDMVAHLHDKINQAEAAGDLDPASADKAKENIMRMGQVATSLASVPNLTAQNKFDLFEVSAKHLSPNGTQAQYAAQVNQVTEQVDSIDRQIPLYQAYPERVAELNQQKQDLIKSLHEQSLQSAQDVLGRRQNFLEGVQNQIVNGQPTYGSLENGLNAINNFREGDIIRGLIQSPKTGTYKVRVRKINSISADGQSATVDLGDTVNLNQISNHAVYGTTRQQQAHYDELAARYTSIAGRNEAPTTAGADVRSDGTGAVPANQSTEGDFDGIDEGWRNRVSRQVTNPLGTVITINPAPDTAFTFTGEWANPRAIEQQERHFKGKTMLLNYPSGEDFARFDGYNEQGDAMLTGLDGDSYSVNPQTLFNSDSGIFAGFLDDSDVQAVTDQQNQNLDTGEDGFITETAPAPTDNAIPDSLAATANLGLSPDERAKINEQQAVTRELETALDSLSTPDEKFILNSIKRILRDLKPGDLDSYRQVQKNLRKLGEIFEGVDLNDVADSLTPDIVDLYEQQQKLNDEQERDRLAQSQPAGRNSQTESTPVNDQNGQSTPDDPQQDQPAPVADSPSESVAAGTTGEGQSQTRPASAANQRTDSPPVTQLTPNSNPLDVVASFQDEMGSLTPAVTSVLNALYSTPNPGPASLHHTTSSYESAGGTPASSVTFAGNKVLFNLEAIGKMTSKEASVMKAWVAGKQLSMNPDVDLSTLAAEIQDGNYTTQKFADSLSALTDPVEIVRSVLTAVGSGNLNPKSGQGGKPSQLLTKLIQGLNPFETGNIDLYGSLANGLVDPGSSYSEKGSASVNPAAVQYSRSETVSTPANKQRAISTVLSLAKLFPRTTVQYLSPEAFVAKFGENQPAARQGNNIYLNEGSVNNETAIHEFGHVWEDIARIYYPQLHAKLLSALKGSKYQSLVEQFYPELTTQEQRDSEMIAQAIGQRGGRLLEGSKLNEFLDWFDRLFTRIAEKLGISSEGIATRKANELFDEVAKLILSDGERSAIADSVAVVAVVEPEPTNIQFVRNTAPRPEAALHSPLQARTGGVSTTGINRQNLAGTSVSDLPTTISRNDLGNYHFSTDQQRELLDNYYQFSDGTIQPSATSVINNKSEKGKPLKRDEYLSGLIQTGKDPVLDANGDISADPADLPTEFQNAADLSRYYFSKQQKQAVFGGSKPAEYYTNADGGKYKLEGSILRDEVEASGRRDKDSRIMRTLIGGSDSFIGKLTLGAISELRNHKTLLMTMGAKGSSIREALGNTLQTHLIGKRAELSLINLRYINEQIEKNKAWTTFRGSNSTDNTVQLPLQSLVTGPFKINNSLATEHPLTKAQAIEMAFIIKTWFDVGKVVTHFDLPATENAKANQVLKLSMSQPQSVELLNKVLAEPGVTELLESWRQHTAKTKPYRDTTYYSIEGEDAPDLEAGQFYWPLNSAGSVIRKAASYSDAKKQLEDASFTNTRKFSQLTYYRVGDVFESMASHFRVIENYVELTPLGHDVSNAIGQTADAAEKFGMKQIAGKIVDNMKNMVTIGSAPQSINLGGVSVPTAGLKRAFYRASLAGNLFVPLKQSTTFDAMLIDGVIDAKYIESKRGLYYGLVGSAYGNMLAGAGEGDTMFGGRLKTFERQFIDEIAANPDASPGYARLLGTVSPDIDPLLNLNSSKGFVTKANLIGQAVGNFQDEHLSAAMKRSDTASVIVAYQAAKAKVDAENTGLSKEERNAKIGALFNQTIVNTHSLYSVTDRAIGANDPHSSGIGNLMMMFQTQTTKQFNRMLQSMIEVAHDPSAAPIGNMRAQMVFNYIVTPLNMATIGLFAGLIRHAVFQGDDEWVEKYNKEPLKNFGFEFLRNVFSSNPGFLGNALNAMLSRVDNGPWKDALIDIPFIDTATQLMDASVQLGYEAWTKEFAKKSQMESFMIGAMNDFTTALNRTVIGAPNDLLKTAQVKLKDALVDEKPKKPTRPKRARKTPAKFTFGQSLRGETSSKFENN